MGWDVNIVSESSKDLFGIRTLDFRFDVSNGEEPDFLTADITDYIECRPFLASEYDEKPYMPGQRYDDKLDDYCFATPGIYLIRHFRCVWENVTESGILCDSGGTGGLRNLEI